MQSALRWFGIFLATSGAARATTWVVDSGGAGNFVDLPTAIAAAAPGDVLRVQLGSTSGQYAGFALDKALVIIGYGGVRITTPISLHDLPAGQRIALVDLSLPHVDVVNCAGPVVITGGYYQAHDFTISASNDVRLAQTEPNGNATHPALDVSASRVEVVDCGVTGGNGNVNAHQVGTAALSATAAARVQVAHSSLWGGAGSDAQNSSFQCADGGPAIALAAPAEVYVMGPQTSLPPLGDSAGQVLGGIGGYLWSTGGFECYADGHGSCAVTGSGVVHDDASVLVQGGYTDTTFHCVAGYYEPRFCGPAELVAPQTDPTLRFDGTPAPGATITFHVFGEPGANVVIYAGRGLIVQPTPGVDIELLVPHNRSLFSGVLDGSGTAVRAITLPATYPTGLVFGVQAEVTGTNGLRRTNSTPIVLR